MRSILKKIKSSETEIIFQIFALCSYDNSTYRLLYSLFILTVSLVRLVTMFLLYRNLKTREKTEMMIETEGEIETGITIGN